MGEEHDEDHNNSPIQKAAKLWLSHVAQNNDKYRKPWMTHVDLMQAIRRDYLTRLQPTKEETQRNSTIQQARKLWLNHVAQNNKNKMHLRHHATLVVKTAPRTQPHRPTCIIFRCHDLVSEGTHELCLYHHNVQAQHFFQRYSPAMRAADLTRSPSDPDYLTMCHLTDPTYERVNELLLMANNTY